MPVSFYPSLRAIILFLFAVYLGIAVAASQHDVLASFVVLSLATWVLMFGILVLVAGRRLRKNFIVEILSALPIDSFTSASNTILYANQNCRISFKFLSRQLFPFTRLQVTFFFQHVSNQSIAAMAFDSADLTQPQHVDFTFPHRGVWTIQKVGWSIQDTMAFWQYRGSKNIDSTDQSSLTVYPEVTNKAARDSFYSSIREGDTAVDMQLLSGDNYDLKAYHPSDGLRKVVWKIYARTGELLARHPEKSMTPEGKVLLFVAGGRFSDHAYAECEAYSRKLLEAGMEVWASGATFKNTVIQNSADDFLRTAIATSFEPVSIEGLDALMQQSESNTPETTTQVGIFLDINFKSLNSASESIELAEQSAAFLTDRGVTPIFFYHLGEVKIADNSLLGSVFFEHDANRASALEPEITAAEFAKITAFLERHNIQRIR